MIILLVISAFLAGCATTWLSLLTMSESSYSAGYAQGYHDAVTGEKENAK